MINSKISAAVFRLMMGNPKQSDNVPELTWKLDFLVAVVSRIHARGTRKRVSAVKVARRSVEGALCV